VPNPLKSGVLSVPSVLARDTRARTNTYSPSRAGGGANGVGVLVGNTSVKTYIYDTTIYIKELVGGFVIGGRGFVILPLRRVA